jgi:hypothetical protein
MPTVLVIGPYRFFFYANDRSEPPHVHVEHDQATAKLWLSPVRLQRSRGFSRGELVRLQRRVESNAETILQAWYDYFAD